MDDRNEKISRTIESEINGVLDTLKQISKFKYDSKTSLSMSELCLQGIRFHIAALDVLADLETTDERLSLMLTNEAHDARKLLKAWTTEYLKSKGFTIVEGPTNEEIRNH